MRSEADGIPVDLLGQLFSREPPIVHRIIAFTTRQLDETCHTST